MEYMAQINIHVTSEFLRALGQYMRKRKIRSKSEAIRQAVREAAERHTRRSTRTDFRGWLGAALKVAPNPRPRFHDEDELWS